MSQPKIQVLHLRIVANAALGDMYWETRDLPDTVQDFEFDLYHGHPQDTDGFTHREEDAVYHIFDKDGYRTLPADAQKLEL